MSELDAAWRSVRDLLGDAAGDFSSALAAETHRVAGTVGEATTTLEDAVGAGTSTIRRAGSDIPATASDISGGTRVAATSSGYRPGRDLLDETDYAALRAADMATATTGADPTMVRIQAQQGFNGLPARITSDEMDAAIAAGQKELFRGFEQESHVQDFLNKPPRPGGGTTGIGTYATPVKQVALRYTNAARRLDGAREDQVLRMTLHPEARTINLRTLNSEHTRAMSQLRRELSAVRNIANRNDAQQARYMALQDKELTISDIGRYAALRGYDAIDGSSVWKNREWLIVNHTALLVQR